MLKTERNTPSMGARVERAFRNSGIYRSLPRSSKGCIRKMRRINADFEHGQWWITDLRTGAQWSVDDAEGSEARGVYDGFCFERVTEGDTSC
jgi:hypothetical protein